MRIRTTPALTATAPSPHTSAWSVTCESIAQRLANQCLEHQPTPTAFASTAHTALEPSHIAWAYSATCASTTTCGRQPPATLHIHSLPTFSSSSSSSSSSTTTSTTTITPPHINTPTSHAPNCHLPRKWEVCISTRFPRGFGCTGDLSPRLSRRLKCRGHRTGLFGQMRIHEKGLDRTPDTPTTFNTSTVHTPPSLHPSAPPPPPPPPPL
nr:unnamed protein product [Spirometra erinaceieuropaei]